MQTNSREFSAYDSRDKWKKIKEDVFHKLENINKEKVTLKNSTLSKAER